ncbi:hypothetical protein GCM10027059_50670 [Myceligenerans halotolerans]
MSTHIKLADVPTLTFRIECGACGVDVESDPDGHTCPVCGTRWAPEAGDGDTGERCDEWDELPGEPLDEMAANLEAQRRAHRRIAAILGGDE